MNLKKWVTFAAAAGFAGGAFAQDSNSLSIEGEAMVTETAAPAHMENVSTIYSGWRFRSTETQALETDDFDNPAFVFVEQGMDLWGKVEGAAEKSCASCHEDVADFAGLRTQLPGSMTVSWLRWKI